MLIRGRTGRFTVGGIFLDMEDFESVTPFTLCRTLLELVAIRYAVKGASNIPLAQVLADAGMPRGDRAAPLVLRAVAQNSVVFIDHPDMYRSRIGQPEGQVFIECNLWFVARWVSKAGGGDRVYSFGATSDDIRGKMVVDLDSSIAKLKSHLKDRPFNPDPDRHSRP